MELKGLLIDESILLTQSQSLEERLKLLVESIYSQVGYAFNLDSPQQLREVLYEEMQYPVYSKTPKGAPSTSEEVLQRLAVEFDLAQDLLVYRSLTKLKNTYVDKLPKLIHSNTGRIHATFHQTGTVTGRLSASNPNVQNIPIKTEEGKAIRKAFIVPEDYFWLSADYSQIELRLMAHLSQDQGLMKAFSDKEDIHARTASMIFELPLEEIDTEKRRQAKAINFGLIYGMSAFGVSKQIGCSLFDAKAYMEIYFEKYPQIKVYMEKQKDFVREHGYVQTVWGRRLYLPDIKSKNHIKRSVAERAAINAPLQGSAADLIKIAMIDLSKKISDQSFSEVDLILQVHDELVYEVSKEQVDAFKIQLEESMITAANLLVPLEVNLKVSDSFS